MRGEIRIHQPGASGVRCAFTFAARRSAALLAVDRALARSGVRLEDVRRIDVVPGPGRFSSVRLGVVIANTLAAARGIPLFVNDVEVATAAPVYGSEPSIG